MIGYQILEEFCNENGYDFNVSVKGNLTHEEYKYKVTIYYEFDRTKSIGEALGYVEESSNNLESAVRYVIMEVESL